MDPDPASRRQPGPAVNNDVPVNRATLDKVTPRYAELRGGVAVITGGAKGIGQGIAFRLAAEGMSVVVADIDGKTLTKTADLLRDRGTTVLAFHGDLSRVDDLGRMFDETLETFGTVDLLVNNAADLERRRLLDEHGELLDLQLAANIKGPYLCSQRAAVIMRDSGGGSIIHISSVGALQAHHRGFPYDVTKGAINAMTLAMAVDLGEYGIRVNAVAPGWTSTYRTERYLEQPAYRAAIVGIPLQKSGTVFDVAAAVAFLASAEAGYITGQVIYVDGGLTAQLGPRASDHYEQPSRTTESEEEGKSDG